MKRGLPGRPMRSGRASGALVHSLLSTCLPDALAPSLRGYFSGLEVPSVLLNPTYVLAFNKDRVLRLDGPRTEQMFVTGWPPSCPSAHS